MNRLDAIECDNPRSDLPPFRPGDTLRVQVRIREGDKERIQVFEGLCIRRRGAGRSETFTVRKVSYGVGVERIFPVQAPIVEGVEIRGRGHVRRARLYFLRALRGKKARLRSKRYDPRALVSPDQAAAEERAAAGPEAAADREAVAAAPERAVEAAGASPAAPEVGEAPDATAGAPEVAAVGEALAPAVPEEAAAEAAEGEGERGQRSPQGAGSRSAGGEGEPSTS